MAGLGLQFTRDERIGTRKSSSSPRGPLSCSPSARTSASSSSFHEPKSYLLDQIITSSLEGKSTYKASLQSEFFIGKRSQPLIDKLSFWAFHNKTMAAMGNPNSAANTRKASIMAFGVVDIVCSPSLGILTVGQKCKLDKTQKTTSSGSKKI